MNFDSLAMAVKVATMNNELQYDDENIPGIYVPFQKTLMSDLSSDASAYTSVYHPAFMVGGNVIDEIYIGKYQAYLNNSRLYSLPGVTPTVNQYIDLNGDGSTPGMFDYCLNKGSGHHLMTAAEWGLMAMISHALGTEPLGNNSYGKDSMETIQRAITATTDANNKTNLVKTGTGPLTYSHDGTVSGVWDLNGNCWEFVDGMRLYGTELQVIPGNNLAGYVKPSSGSIYTTKDAAWRAVNAAATSYDDLYIATGSSGAVKLSWVSSHWQWDTTATATSGNSNALFSATTYGSGISAFCKAYLQMMALGPISDGADYGSNKIYANTSSATTIRVPVRGGAWSYGAFAGVFSLHLSNAWSYRSGNIGGRAAWKSN